MDNSTKRTTPHTRKAKLNLLQRLQTCAAISDYREMFASGSTNDVEVAHIAEAARTMFFKFTGFFPHDISRVELNNMTPSERITAALVERADRWN